jgi:hypothetical protein
MFPEHRTFKAVMPYILCDADPVIAMFGYCGKLEAIVLQNKGCIAVTLNTVVKYSVLCLV